MTDAPADNDGQLFPILDAYVDALHRRDHGSQSVLLSQHPEIVELLGQLQMLDRLSIEPEANSGPSDPGSDATIIWRGDWTETPLPELEPAADECGNGQPQRFGKYRLLEERGRGGMGVVFRAWQTDLGRCVAVKMILQSRLASPEDVRRFYVEARSAGSLRHPNVVGIHEVGECHGQPYFAMDYVDGPSLTESLADGPFEPDRAAQIVAAVARAVHYLHENGIIHRDLKPSNVLLDKDGTPFVTDFGLAKVFTGSDSGKTQTGTIVGTPSYMAPEQAAGHTSRISPRSDVYSLGAILYELLVGRPPFQRDNPLDTLVDVLEGEPTLLCQLRPSLPRELEIIVLKCLEKDPDNRYATAAELADDLERYLRRDPIAAQPSNPWVKLRRWARRQPALAAHAVGLGVAAGIVQVNYWLTVVDLTLHLTVMGVLAAWGIVSCLYQWMLHREHLASAARYLWSATDIVLLTVAFYYTEGPHGPLVVAYPVLVTAAGMFFVVRLVLFTTALAMGAFGALLCLRPDAGPAYAHYTVIFLAATAVHGLMVAYQVYRVRVLSRHFEQRPM